MGSGERSALVAGADGGWPAAARELVRLLGLRTPPVAIAFAADAPASLSRFAADAPEPTRDGRTGAVAAGCIFWFEATRASFTTRPEDHFNCSVGSVTHGLKRLEEVASHDDVQAMLRSGWVSEPEAGALPGIRGSPQWISYGPLEEAGFEPDVILLRLTPAQAMLLMDARPETPVVGKPQCHIIPLAVQEAPGIALSTGCMLSRIRTRMPQEELTCAVSAARVHEILQGLAHRRQANAAVRSYASEDLARFG